ncbi:hypothetical protein IG206_02530 [Candidatus Parvarchaeota archaeon]|nr:hypothetical protein [Candidatus Acidifodinimicrobium mancum]
MSIGRNMANEALSSFGYGFSVYRNKYILISAVAVFLIFLFVGYFIIYSNFDLYIHNPLVQSGLYVSGYDVTASSALFVIVALIALYFINFSLNEQRRFNGKVKLGMIVSISNRTYLKFLITSSVQIILSVIGSVLFVIPGLYLGTKTFFLGASSIYYDDDLLSSFRRAFSASKGNSTGSFIVFLLYLILSAFLIYLALVVSSSVLISYVIYGFILSFLLISFFSSAYRLLSFSSNKKTRLEELTSGFAESESRL